MKKMILLLGLILGICNMGVTAFAEESLVEVQIDTRPNKVIHEGTESISFDIYDLTDWREKRASDEKTDKEYILNTYPSKKKLETFVKNEQLAKYNQAPISVDGDGKTTIELPRKQTERDAAYLILASGEKGKYSMLPIVIYLPQQHPVTKEEAFSLLYNSKYDEIPTTPPTTDTSTTEPKATDSSEPKKNLPKTIGTPSDGGPKSFPKNLPSTNELIRNYCFLGLSIMLVGLVGLKRRGGKNYEK